MNVSFRVVLQAEPLNQRNEIGSTWSFALNLPISQWR